MGFRCCGCCRPRSLVHRCGMLEAHHSAVDLAERVVSLDRAIRIPPSRSFHRRAMTQAPADVKGPPCDARKCVGGRAGRSPGSGRPLAVSR